MELHKTLQSPPNCAKLRRNPAETYMCLAGRFQLDRIAKDAATIANENQPLLGGEHYLTDRELSQRLKISRCTLQDYRNNCILPYRQLGGKILYRESDIERVSQSCYRGKF